MKKIIVILCLLPLCSIAQNFTSYFTGSIIDTMTQPMGGICLMGGATEEDHAMKWFLQRANGGDVLVLRTSGSDGYNNYLYSSLGIPVNSVETIVCHNASASNDPYLHQKIKQAEAIWFAGGDQWKYVSFWRNTPVDSLINLAVQKKGIAIGGTSAGMAILGNYYFSAQHGTVTSTAALLNPYNSKITVDSTAFISIGQLNQVITDTHFDNPDRKGRLVVFLSRIFTDYGVSAKAIACDEYTAVCIDADGIAKVFGDYPAYDEEVYFIQTNCGIILNSPEMCIPGSPLTWNLGGEALKVYNVKGTSSGSNTFNLNDWKSGEGGIWLNWSVEAGTFKVQTGTAIDCNAASVAGNETNNAFELFPNPTTSKIIIRGGLYDFKDCKFKIFNNWGQTMAGMECRNSGNELEINTNNFNPGLYHLLVQLKDSKYITISFFKISSTK